MEALSIRELRHDITATPAASATTAAANNNNNNNNNKNNNNNNNPRISSDYNGTQGNAQLSI